MKNWEKEFDKDFGAYAIMGKLGKLYNGAFANGTRMSDVKDFIQNLLDKQKEEIKEKANAYDEDGEPVKIFWS